MRICLNFGLLFKTTAVLCPFILCVCVSPLHYLVPLYRKEWMDAIQGVIDRLKKQQKEEDESKAHLAGGPRTPKSPSDQSPKPVQRVSTSYVTIR